MCCNVDMERKEQNHVIIHIPPSSMCVCVSVFFEMHISIMNVKISWQLLVYQWKI